MKKIVALLMSLVLLCCGAALAEEALIVETQTMTSVTGLFTLEVPADYVIMDGEVMQALFEGMDSEFWQEAGGESGYSEAEIQAIIDALGQLDVENQDFVYAPDFISNMNAVVSPSSGLTRDMLPMAKTMLDEMLIDQYVAMLGIAAEDCTTKDLIELGENAYTCYVFQLEAYGTTLQQYITLMDDGTQITITFTGIDEETALSIVDTIVFLDPVAAA